MNIALIGSSDFPVIQCGIEIARFIKELPPDTIILTRNAKGFDAFAAEVARQLDRNVVEYPGKGGMANYERDVQLARDADKVIAFFSEGKVGQGGTQHVIDKALDLGKPVESYAPLGRGFVLVGSDDARPGQSGGGRRGAFRSAEGPGEEAPERPREERRGPPVW